MAIAAVLFVAVNEQVPTNCLVFPELQINHKKLGPYQEPATISESPFNKRFVSGRSLTDFRIRVITKQNSLFNYQLGCKYKPEG